MEQAMRKRTKFGRHSSGLRGFKAEIAERGASGLKPPQIDREQAGASDHGFLSGGSPRRGLAAKNMWKLPKAPPGWSPALETPNRFRQQSAHATVAQSIDTAKL